MRFLPLLLCAVFFLSTTAFARDDDSPWFRDVGEWTSTRSTRQGVPTDDNFKLLTDGTRFDVSVGKRIPLLVWGEKDEHTTGWTLGIDGGMLASLTRVSHAGGLRLPSTNFDGFFGAFVSYTENGWLAMLRSGHLSAHLVDDASNINKAIIYSRFWNELIAGKDFPNPKQISDWDLYFQGGIGANNTCTPACTGPRSEFGISAGYELGGINSLAALTSFDMTKAGVQNQAASYSEFLGVGYLTRPHTTHRPLRIGVSHFHGSDYRNQNYLLKQNFTAFETQLEF